MRPATWAYTTTPTSRTKPRRHLAAGANLAVPSQSSANLKELIPCAEKW
jgi:hypothetical protein